MRRLDRLRGRKTQPVERSYDLGWLASQLATGTSPITTWGQTEIPAIESGFRGLAAGAYRSNGVIFAIMLARHLLFTEVRFQFQELRGGRPGKLFGTPALDILEQPWTNGTTASLLARMEQDASLVGNFFGLRVGDHIRRLDPERVTIVLGSPDGHEMDFAPVGYVYERTDNRTETFLPHQICHFAPVPDPLQPWRGMSWLTPILREIQADQGATMHKERFFENAATPNLAISLDQQVTIEQFREFVREMETSHSGAANAYKTLYLAGGADVTVVGADLKQLNFSQTQGAGETRMCAAAGVPPVIVGLSEGLQSATYSNYGMARRLFGDHWARPNWRTAAGTLEAIVDVPDGARLWYDDRDVSFLAEDRKDDAEITRIEASTIESLIRAGYTPESCVEAIESGDFTRLEHTGLYSVQLQRPESNPVPVAEGDP